MIEKYKTLQEVYEELDDIAGRFIMIGGSIDYKESYEMLKKDIRKLRGDILKDNPEFQR